MIPYVITVVIHGNDADGAQRPPVFRSKIWTLIDRGNEKGPWVQWLNYYRVSRAKISLQQLGIGD